MIWLVKIDIYQPGFFLIVYDTEEWEKSTWNFFLLLQCMFFSFYL